MHNALDTSVMQRCHTDHVVLGQVHVPLCVVDIGDVIHIATVVRTAHPQLRMLLTKTVVGFVKEVVLVWIQLQRDTVLLVPDRNRRCGIIRQLHPFVLGQTRFALWKECEILVP